MKHPLSLFICVLCALCGSPSFSAEPDRSPTDLGSVLVFSGTGWYRHPEVVAVSGWLARLSDDLGMQVDVTENPADLVKILDHYQVLVFNNCTELPAILDEEQRRAVEDWYQKGGGIVALHAALVHQTEWPWFTNLGGCDFVSDSEFLEAKVLVDPAAKDHPAIKGAPAEFMHTADWTNHTESVTGKPGFRVLLRVDESTYEPVRKLFIDRGNAKPMGDDHPIAWTNTLNDGRFFYTELGHDVTSVDTKFGRRHILGAIRWAARVDEPSKPAK